MSEDISTLIQRLCEPLETIASLTGDDLLNIGGRRMHKETGMWPFRSFWRGWNRSTRPYIINDITTLLSEVRGTVNLILESRYLSHYPDSDEDTQQNLDPSHREQVSERLQNLDTIKNALRASISGIEAQAQHYEKISDPTTPKELRRIAGMIETTATKIEKKVHVLREHWEIPPPK